MGASKPCLGHPSRTAAIRALRADGLSTSAIAAKIGCSSSVVTSLECARATRKVGTPTAQPIRQTSLSELFTHEEAVELRRAAAARDMSVEGLVRTIVQTVVAESLIDAVLDDRQPERRRA